MHALLWETLAGVVPHWGEPLKRRWIRDFMPHWRVDLMEVARQQRYLHIAMRRGWFDEAQSARRWVAFIELLDAHPGKPSPACTVNLFNLVAVLPVVPDDLRLPSSLKTLLYEGGVLTAATLTTCLEALGTEYSELADAPDATLKLYHVRQGRALTATGHALLHHAWREHGLAVVCVLEPFGLEPWHMVNALGLDARGQLIAYHRIENLSAELSLARDHVITFHGETRRHEPTHLAQPDMRPSPYPAVLPHTFDAGHGLRAGITSHGALALLAASSSTVRS